MTYETYKNSLSGDSFDEYLKACRQFSNYIKSGETLDQEIVERVLFVNVLPIWAEHDDFISRIHTIIQTFSKLYEETKEHSFIAVHDFALGLLNNEFDISGFFTEESGYFSSFVCCNIAIDRIKGKENLKHHVPFIKETGAWFNEIEDVTKLVHFALEDVRNWNDGMILGLKNTLNACYKLNLFEWILSALHNVVNETIIQKEIFNHYIEIYTNLKSKDLDPEDLEFVNKKIEKLEKLAKGEDIYYD